MGAVRASRPRFRREGDAPSVALTPDDIDILQRVYRHRFVRAEDLYPLYAPRSPDRLSRRLTTLYRAGYLDRPIAQIDRYGQGGSQSMIYGLDNRAARFLKEVHGVPIGATNWRSRNRSFGRQNLEHTIAVSKFAIDLELAVRAAHRISLISFDEVLAAAPETTRMSPHPLSWTVPVQWHGGKANVQLAPDTMFGLRVVGAEGRTTRSHFFVEVDRGTMTVVPSEETRSGDAFPYRATILRKLHAYADSFALRLHEQRFNIATPRVVFVVSGEARLNTIRRAAAEFTSSRKLPSGMFITMLFEGVGRPDSIKSMLEILTKGAYP